MAMQIKITKKKGEVNTYVIDLFCGAGGTSTAIKKSKTKIKVVACINHDKNAIISHLDNHPYCLHFIEDIRTIGLQPIIDLVNWLRKEDPGCRIALWASLECTNFSIAKGGMPRDADSRSLAEHLFRYLDAIDPDFLWIENVREFMSWGPLDKNGKPLSRDKGLDYKRWVEKVKSYGYHFDSRLLNAADFEAYTSRIRYFAQFSKDPNLISWPKPTRAKKISKQIDFMNPVLKVWKAVKDVLDLMDEGVSIFRRKKPYVENTLKRLLAGLIKFVANGDDSFMWTYYGNSSILSLGVPAPTVTTKDRICKTSIKFMDNQYKSSKPTSIDSPNGTLTVRPKQSLVSVSPILINKNSSTAPSKSTDDPCPTITQRTHYLMNPQYNSKGSCIDNPCFTLIARMDKAPPYIISTQKGNYANVIITPEDSETMIKIKFFMVKYGISDIKMRMLKIPELLQIQGFPKDYKLTGTQTEQKKYIGNSVEVNVGIALFEAIDQEIQKIAA